MRYLLKKIAFLLLTAWVALTINFMLPRLMPGDPATTLIAKLHGRLGPEAVDAIKISFGLVDMPKKMKEKSFNNLVIDKLDLMILDLESKKINYIQDNDRIIEIDNLINKTLEDKEKVMKEAGKNYIKIYGYAIRDSIGFNELMNKIVFTRIDKILKDTSPLEVTEEFRGYEKYLRMFVLDALRMIDKIKVENQNFEQVDHKAQKRIMLVLEIFINYHVRYGKNIINIVLTILI